MHESANNVKVRLRNIIEQWSITTFFLFLSVKLSLFFYKRIPKLWNDGWRRTTEAHHRTEESKFISGISNIALKTDAETPQQINEYIIEKLYSVLKDNPEMFHTLIWKRFAALRIPSKHIDFIIARYTNIGELEGLSFYPDGLPSDGEEINITVTQKLLEKIVFFYNQTRNLADKKRTRTLFRNLVKWVKKQKFPSPKKDVISLIVRMLGANWISFKEAEIQSKSRYVPYFFTDHKHAGMGILNMQCNVSYDSRWADLWSQISHICLDGRIGTKLLKKIKRSFGLHDSNENFPESFVSHISPVHYKPSDRDVYNGCDFIDFGKLLKSQEELREEFGNIIPVSLLIWGIAQHPLFKDVKFNVPVDIPAQNSRERSVGFVFIKPSFFMKKRSKRDAFEDYLNAFNHQVQQIRKRTGESYLFLQTAAIIPHWMIVLILKLIPKALVAFTGTCCVTIIEGCEYVIPPLSDNIKTCIVVSLPQERNRTLGCVGVRSYNNNTQEILSALKVVVKDFAEWIRLEEGRSNKIP